MAFPIQPCHGEGFQRIGLALGQVLILIDIAPLILGHIVDHHGALQQAADRNIEGHNPGNGGSRPILGHAFIVNALGQFSVPGHGNLSALGDVLAVQRQLHAVVYHIRVPFLGCRRRIGNLVPVGVDSGFTDGIEGNFCNQSSHIIRGDCILSGCLGQRVPTAILLNCNPILGKQTQHTVGQFGTGNIFAVLVDDDRPVNLLVVGIILAGFGQRGFLQQDGLLRRNRGARNPLPGGQGGCIAHLSLVLGNCGGVGDGITLGIFALRHLAEGNSRDGVAFLDEGVTIGGLNCEFGLGQAPEHIIRQGGASNIQSAGVDGDGPIQLIRDHIVAAVLAELDTVNRHIRVLFDFVLRVILVRDQDSGVLLGYAVPGDLHRGIVGDGVLALIGAALPGREGDLAGCPVHRHVVGGRNGNVGIVLHLFQHQIRHNGLGQILAVVVDRNSPLDVALSVRSHSAALIQGVAHILRCGNRSLGAVLHLLTLLLIL